MNQSRRHNVITIDLEDWFHGLEPDITKWPTFPRRCDISVRRLLNLFREFDVKATFFVLGDVAIHSPKLIEEIAEAGHEIGTHGMHHQFIYKQTPVEFSADIKNSLEILRSITGQNIESYRAPYFSITKESLWAVDILRDEGIKYDSSIFPVHNPRYGIPGASRTPYQVAPDFWEFPVATLPAPVGNIPVGGGFYFRFWPLVFTSYALHKIEKRDEPALLYFHPWEFDPRQPRYRPLSYFAGARHYYRLNSTMKKFVKILGNNKFTTLSSALKNYLDLSPIEGKSAEITGDVSSAF